eukprot:8712538-Karenia_brevis.AAC.1
MAPGGLSGALWGNFLAWARKLLQEASLGLSGFVFWSELGKSSRRPLWGCLGQFSGLGSKITPGDLSGAFWGRFLVG